MIAFLDFEASSLEKTSYPIEVAWVFETGLSRTALIRPLATWTDWSAKAEAMHGISRELLMSKGIPVGLIAEEMIETLSGHRLYASAPSWDGKWLSVLLRGAGLARHALRLRKSDEAFVEAARDGLGASCTDAQIVSLVENTLKTVRSPDRIHRAMPDAVLELERWRAVKAAVLSTGGS